MQMPDSDPPISNPIAPKPPVSNLPNANPHPFRSTHHRRAHSEVAFRIPDDIDLAADPFGPANGSSSSNLDEIGSEDDFFCTYMDMENLDSKMEDSVGQGSLNGGPTPAKSDEKSPPVRPRHRHSNSVDGSMTTPKGGSVFGEIADAKKAMASDKLAELAAIDPKRAKRILANRQSAARSKERKTHYISELERKVRTLQTEATTLSAQLALFQRDTTGLTTENTELKVRLQAMEQQAHLRDALNEALKQEVERFKVATGEILNPNESFNLGMYHMPYSQSPFFSLPQQPPPASMQLPQYHHPTQRNIPHNQLFAQSHPFSDMMQQDSLGRLQGLDISRSSHIVKTEGSSISASESSSTF
ncbi:transcription factor RF2b-like [Aristolochia californica]|uniref:transcription factor RF2b-like n=1 Tax=Aristolochia californica TaxID=171875 RepID=UPI0035E30D96